MLYDMKSESVNEDCRYLNFIFFMNLRDQIGKSLLGTHSRDLSSNLVGSFFFFDPCFYLTVLNCKKKKNRVAIKKNKIKWKIYNSKKKKKVIKAFLIYIYIFLFLFSVTFFLSNVLTRVLTRILQMQFILWNVCCLIILFI